MDARDIAGAAWGWKPRTVIAGEMMAEAFTHVKKRLGDVPFKTSTLGDPHIREIIKATSARTGVPEAEIEGKISKEVAKIEEFKKYSYLLYDTAARNAVETAAFDLIEKAAEHPGFGGANGRIMFSVSTFNKLVRMVEQENHRFFPHRAPGEVNYIWHIDPILVPNTDSKFAKLKSVNTAAATANGEFIFSVPFMQKLMDFATAEGLQPKGRKYQSNGGTIPDAYAYIEFLIMHEFLHYSEGDFTAFKRMPQYSHQVHNYASDFRSNYLLVKSGYDQLPLGLFSDHLNYDRQGSYASLVKLVDEELKKLPKPLQDDFEKISGMDEPVSQPEEGQKDGQTTPTNHDDVHGDIESKLGSRQETSGKPGDDGEQTTTPGKTSQSPSKTPGPGGMSDLQSREDAMASIRPTMNWKSILAKMVRSSTSITDTSYAKPARRSLTGLPVAAARGAMAVKPGEKTLDEPQNKICLVLDTSGSMGDVIPRVLVECQRLLTMVGRSNLPIAVAFFAGSHQWYQVNLGNDTYARVQGPASLSKRMEKTNTKKNWKSLLSSAGTGGTVLSGSLQADISSLEAQGWNVVMFSDSDLLHGNNWDGLRELWSAHKNSFFFVADGQDTFNKACAKLGLVPKTWTHL